VAPKVGGQVAQQAERSLEHGVEATEARARAGSGWYAWAARAGLVAAGVSYVLVGVLAIGVAVDAGGRATSRDGALRSVAGQPFGEVVLVLLAIGFASYALWRLIQAIALREEPDGEIRRAKTWGKRAVHVARAVVYAGLAFVAVRVLLGTRGESQTEQARETTATVLEWPAGTWIVALIGVYAVGLGLVSGYRGLTTKFEEHWRPGKMSRRARAWATPIAVIGHLARGLVFALVGTFLVKAALEYEPREAVGLDGALRRLAEASHGPWLLGLVAAGLIAYGLYCLVDARYRDVSARE
jgi:hypothetical protein